MIPFVSALLGLAAPAHLHPLEVKSRELAQAAAPAPADPTLDTQAPPQTPPAVGMAAPPPPPPYAGDQGDAGGSAPPDAGNAAPPGSPSPPP